MAASYQPPETPSTSTRKTPCRDTSTHRGYAQHLPASPRPPSGVARYIGPPAYRTKERALWRRLVDWQRPPAGLDHPFQHLPKSRPRHAGLVASLDSRGEQGCMHMGAGM